MSYRNFAVLRSFMVSDTPFEVHVVNGVDVYVKREDLCCLPPGPPYSKMRGLELFLHKQEPGTPIGVQDAGFHSRSGWGTAYLCSKMGMPCYVGYPVFKREGTIENHELREYQCNARDLGAHLIPVKAGRASVAYYQARNIFLEMTDGEGIMLPAGLKLKESVEGTAIEVREHTPKELRCGTWIISISSGTVAAGVIAGLEEYEEDIDFICYFGSQKNMAKTRRYMIEMAGYEPSSLAFVDEGWKYSDEAHEVSEFPASVFYEAKTWWWLNACTDALEEPIIFWNIGT